jgi:beta propeller repeat protein
MSGRVMVCQISSGLVFGIGSALAIQEPRICGSKVVWREGGAGVTQVMLYDLSWLGTARDADILAGPIPPTYSVDIGDRFVVWAERTSGQQDIVAYDLTAGVRVAVTSTPGVNESEPSSSGAWIVWQAQDKGVTNSRVLARNLDTAEERVIVDNGVFNYRPSVDGDLIAYEGIANGHLDVSVYRISTGETFQITTNSADQYLADVFGNNVAYVDQRTGNEDIYVSHLQFVPSIPLSTNANLAGLVLSAGTLTPAFDPAVTNYTATVPNHTNSVTVTPTSADANATIQVRVNAGAWSNVLSGTASAPLPLSVGANLIDVKVTAQDLTAKIYTLVVTREPNLPPVADAGPDRNAYTEFAITLQGTAYDPDGEPVIGWYWAVDQSPCGNCWLLFDDTTPTPTFKASINGDYVLLLVVEDPTGISAADFVTVHVRSNLPPVAVATADRTNITVGATVCFDGSQSSDPEAGPLSYTWNFGDGSLSARTNAVCHTFTDVGTYDVGLQVRDERGAYDFDFVSITVLPPAVLRVALTSTNTVLLAWPAALTGYDLQQNADLATTNWLAVTNPSVVVGDEKQVIFDPNPGNRFYRLHKP